ncbi:hypothetical protein FKG94_02795 [Exilibacterium tricleocarpae]|uniref:Spore coat protein U domain-containing protein n=1 Tax=Exilibacterium tricleocarpae TaxID=2591008 RepID=A0A545U6R7_9GAMM|nr:hypothetical protein [Exilibacterium tricleocarpae]TQV85134.1 hypothetical protein FKG94_02795 [Exilibacterium tricleocarpae]
MSNTLHNSMYSCQANPPGRRFRLCAVLLGVLVSAHSAAEVELSGLDDIAITAWAGATGNLVGSDTFCSRSCARGCERRGHRRNYDTAAYTNGVTDGAGNFYISNGADNLLVYLDWTHPTAGTTRLTNYSVTRRPTPRVPGAYSCTQDPNSQTSIAVTLPADQLAGASAGVYAETFRLDLCRRVQGGLECTAEVSFSVNLPELVQVTNLNDVDLGTWNGQDDLQVSEEFCVFRNGKGGVAIRTNGGNDTATQFNLSGPGTIPYTVEYSQGGGFFAAQPGVTISAAASGFAGESVRDCTNVGGTNTTVRISVSAGDIGTSAPGSYDDTVTIYVEPD